MEHNRNNLGMTTDGIGKSEKSSQSGSNRRWVTSLFLVAAVLVGLVNWMVATGRESQSEFTAQASSSAAVNTSNAPVPSADTEYSPRRYLNQSPSQVPEEHIQAF